MGRFRRLIDGTPGLRAVTRRISERRLRAGGSWRFWGAWDSRAAAVEWASSSLPRPTGYDQPGLAEEHRWIYEMMHLFDYPAMHWLGRFLEGVPDPCIADIGGHFGAKKARYDERGGLPDSVRWIVCETPSVVAAAQGASADAVPAGVVHAHDLDAIGEADVVLASGVLQYLDDELWTILGRLSRKPRGIVVNKVPLSDGPEFWTIEKSGHAAVPYHVFNKTDFIDAMSGVGYEVADMWELGWGVTVPYHEGLGTERNSGVALRLQGSA